MKLIDQARRAGTTLAIACLGAGATMTAGALILDLGTPAAFARQRGLPANPETAPRTIEDAQDM